MFRALGVVLLSLLSLTVAAGEPTTSPTLTVATWGGAYEAAQREAIFQPFTEATGIDLNIVPYGGGVLPLQAQATGPAKARWDVVDMLRADARQACKAGWLTPFDPAILAPAPDGTPANQDFHADAITDCYVAQLVFASVIAYNDRAFPGEKPQTIADFFDQQRFPGKRALRAAPVGLFEWGLRAYGVPLTQIYDLLSTARGLRLALQRLEGIRDSLIWWQDAAEPTRLLTQGEVTMASGYNGRFFHARVIDGAPISIIWNSALLAENVWAIPQNTPHTELAERFIRFATASERLAAMANRIAYGPTRHSAQRRVGLHVDTEIPMPPHLPTAAQHLKQALKKDYAWYAATSALRQRRFETWQAEYDNPQ